MLPSAARAPVPAAGRAAGLCAAGAVRGARQRGQGRGARGEDGPRGTTRVTAPRENGSRHRGTRAFVSGGAVYFASKNVLRLLAA